MTLWYIYTTKYYLAARKNEIMIISGEYMSLETIILGEVIQIRRDKHCMFFIGILDDKPWICVSFDI